MDVTIEGMQGGVKGGLTRGGTEDIYLLLLDQHHLS